MRTLSGFSKLRRFVAFALLALCAVMLSSCYKITYRVADRSGSTITDERTVNYFLFGLVPTREHLDLSVLCPAQRLTQVKTSQKPVNVLHAILGGYLTSSYSVNSVCLKQGAAEATK